MDMNKLIKVIILLTIMMLFTLNTLDCIDIIANMPSDKDKYNNGICPKCKAKWLFVEKNQSLFNESYIYECENGHIIELNKLPEIK